MKIWGNEHTAYGYIRDEKFTYHICIIVKRNIVVAIATKNQI